MGISSKQSLIIVVLLLGGFFTAAVLSLLGSGSDSNSVSLIKSSPTEAAVSSANSSDEAIAQQSTPAAIVGGLTEQIGTLTGGTVETKLDAAGPLVEIKNFKRSESKDGKLAWELAGSRAAYRVGSSQVQLEDAVISTRISSGELVTLSTPRAVVAISGTALQEASASAHEGKFIEITTDSGIKIVTPQARYRAEQGEVQAQENIKIFHPRGSQTADNMQGNTRSGVFVFTGNVHTTILPAS